MVGGFESKNIIPKMILTRGTCNCNETYHYFLVRNPRGNLKESSQMPEDSRFDSTLNFQEVDAIEVTTDYFWKINAKSRYKLSIPRESKSDLNSTTFYAPEPLKTEEI